MFSVKRFLSATLIAGRLSATLCGAQAQNPAPNLSIEDPKAKVAFARGLAAVQLGSWAAAIDAFLEARESEWPANPMIYFNLGLAFEKGNDPLLAACYLQVYLRILPKASNADLVRREIADLERAINAKAAPILASIETVAGSIQGRWRERARFEAYRILAESYARLGQSEKAIAAGRTASSVTQSHVDLGPIVWLTYAETLAEAGDAQKAQNALNRAEKMFSPVPPNYRNDKKLELYVRNYYSERERLAENVKSKIADPQPPDIDFSISEPCAISLNSAGYFKDVPSYKPTPPLSMNNLDGQVKTALYLYKYTGRTFPFPSNDDNLAVLQWNTERMYANLDEIQKIGYGERLLGGKEAALILALGNIVATYASEMAKYQYMKELFKN